MKTFTKKEIGEYLKLARAKNACKGNIEAAEKAFFEGDIETVIAIARANRSWCKQKIDIDSLEIGNGKALQYYENGQLWEDCFYQDGKLQGEYRSYYKNGQLWEDCFCQDGKLQGEYRGYYKNGQLWEDCFYQDGKLQGEYRSYYENGQLMVECFYQDSDLQ